MKKLNFCAKIALLTLAILCVSVDSYGQKLSKKEQKRQQIQEWMKGLTPSPITVTFDSQPQGAKVVVDGKVVGITPVTTKVNVIYGEPSGGYRFRDYVDGLINVNKISVRFLKDGYLAGEEYIEPAVQYESLYGRIGYRFSWQDGVFCELKRGENTVAIENNTDNSIPAGEAQKVVNRDNPGQTALEKTVIRWNFESQPQGARIFWRVISSIPDQVKNTNELWLGYTPFEETRSFNIQGLTYENSRDVQIEIKVRRQGYLDQTKRFNVRQAIDQQEISSFFDMIKTE